MRSRAREPELPVIIFSGTATSIPRSAIGRGAMDFIEKPFEAERLLLLVARATETERLRRENARLREGFVTSDEFTGNSGVINSGPRHAQAGGQYRQPPADHWSGRLRQGSGGTAAP
jgi:DNA-binding NtrC family response regulator